MGKVRGRAVNFDDIDEDDLTVDAPAGVAGGLKAVGIAFERGLKQGGVSRTVRSIYRVNQPKGVDCPGCAWPESTTGHRIQEVDAEAQAWCKTTDQVVQTLRYVLEA